MTIYVGGYTPVQILVGDLTTAVRDNVGDEETTSSMFRDSDVARWANDGIAAFSRRTKAFRLQATQTILAGVTSIPLPLNFRGFEEVRLDGKAMERQQSLSRRLPAPVGRPRYYTVIGDNFVFDKAYDVDFEFYWDYFYLPLLSNSLFHTLTNIPVQYTSVIVNYASSQAALMITKPDPKLSTYYGNLYEQAVLNIIGEIEDASESSNVEIRDVFDPYSNSFDQRLNSFDQYYYGGTLNGF